MPTENLQRLAALIHDRRDELLTDWRTQVKLLPGAADLDVPTINDEVPQLLDSLAEELIRHSEEADAEVRTVSVEHGLLRLQLSAAGIPYEFLAPELAPSSRPS
jgi:hypothetical protein